MMELHYIDDTAPPEAIGPNKQSIGSSPKCDIKLIGSEGVYPIHAHTWSDKDSIVLSLKIGAKVMVNDEKFLLRAVLHHGDKVLIGDTSMEVRESDIKMGFRDKIMAQGDTNPAYHIEQPSLNVEANPRHSTAIPAAQPQHQEAPTSTSAHIAEASQTSAISRQRLAPNNNEQDAGLHLREISTPECEHKTFSRQRKMLSLLLFGVGALLFANLLLAAF